MVELCGDSQLQQQYSTVCGGVGSVGGMDPDGLSPLISSLRPETRRATQGGPLRRAAPVWCPNRQANCCAAQAGPQAPEAVHTQPGRRTRSEGWSGGTE